LIGMVLAYRKLVGDKWTGLLMAFGAGAIISAAAYQLVLGPIIEDKGKYMLIGLGMAAGALVFYFADQWVDHLGGTDRMDMDGAQASRSGLESCSVHCSTACQNH
jgi:zinc transporter, ZIP family